jgi:hypothetical protein
MTQQFPKNPGLNLSEDLAPFLWVSKDLRTSFVREATHSLHIQDAAMTRAAVALNGWLDRRHAGVTATVETLQHMNECTNQEEVLGLQRKLLAGYCARWTHDVTMATEELFAAYQRGIFALHATMTGSFPSVMAAPAKTKVEAELEPAKA